MFNNKEIENYTFWSIYTTDPNNKNRALFPDSELDKEIVKIHTADYFNVSVDDVLISSQFHNTYNREVITTYLKSGHKAKIQAKIDFCNLMIATLKNMDK